jgi:hypothetical protein
MIQLGPCPAGGYHGSWETCERCAPVQGTIAQLRQELDDARAHVGRLVAARDGAAPGGGYVCTTEGCCVGDCPNCRYVKAMEERAALLDYLADWVDGRDVLIRVSESPDSWARDDHMWAEVDVRHWPDHHESLSAALRRVRQESGSLPDLSAGAPKLGAPPVASPPADGTGTSEAALRALIYAHTADDERRRLLLSDLADLAAATRRAEEAERDMARLDSGCIRLTLQAADGRQGILYRDVDLRAAIDDAMARTPRPERCGCFVAATGEVCTQPTDHIGPHIFASDSAARTPTPEVSTTQPEDDR